MKKNNNWVTILEEKLNPEKVKEMIENSKLSNLSIFLLLKNLMSPETTESFKVVFSHYTLNEENLKKTILMVILHDQLDEWRYMCQVRDNVFSLTQDVLIDIPDFAKLNSIPTEVSLILNTKAEREALSNSTLLSSVPPQNGDKNEKDINSHFGSSSFKI